MVTTKKKHIAYNLMMAFLSLLIAVILIVQLTLHLSFNINVILTNTACIIWIIFVVDYITRFVLSNDKKSFVKNNIIDLISIIPFHTFFILLSNYGILKLGKYVILLKLVMVLRIVAIIKKVIVIFINYLKLITLVILCL